MRVGRLGLLTLEVVLPLKVAFRSEMQSFTRGGAVDWSFRFSWPWLPTPWRFTMSLYLTSLETLWNPPARFPLICLVIELMCEPWLSALTIKSWRLLQTVVLLQCFIQLPIYQRSGSLKLWNMKTTACIRTMDCSYAICSTFLPGDRHVCTVLSAILRST